MEYDVKYLKLIGNSNTFEATIINALTIPPGWQLWDIIMLSGSEILIIWYRLVQTTHS